MNPEASESVAAVPAAAAFEPNPIASVMSWLPRWPVSAVRAPCTTLPGSVASYSLRALSA